MPRLEAIAFFEEQNQKEYQILADMIAEIEPHLHIEIEHLKMLAVLPAPDLENPGTVFAPSVVPPLRVFEKPE